MNKNSFYICVFFITLFSSCQSITENETQSIFEPNYKNNKVALNQLINNNEFIDVRINKSTYKLSVIRADTVVKEYKVVFGENPVDDKRMEGDKCTPEGDFKMQDKYPHRKWHKFIWINYPTPASHKKHNLSKRKGEIPKNATVGGEVGIHGTRPGKDYLIDDKINWTWGCIAMKNSDLDEIYPFINKKSNIVIR